MRLVTSSAVGAAAIAAIAVALVPAQAHAGIAACGDIHVEAHAQCEVVPPGATCKGMCTPVSVRAACAAQLAVDCRAGCDDLPSVDCSASCEGSCQAECTELEPGEFDCNAACEADCGGECEAQCSADADGSECMARCEGNCSASCDSSCDVQLPEADCDAGCEASCEGSCEADANFDCQADCQAMGEADCELDVEGGCEVECDTQEGALFCDGEYVDHGDNLDECIAALRATLDIQVQTHAEGESSCGGGGCEAHGVASAKVNSDCNVVAPGARPAGTGGALAAFGLVALGICLRRRRG